jgi:ferritin-like metal-binding protein YciE
MEKEMNETYQYHNVSKKEVIRALETIFERNKKLREEQERVFKDLVVFGESYRKYPATED